MNHEATLLLEKISAGDPHAADKLLPLIYDELRGLAGSYFKGRQAGATLQPTALVHEAYVRLIDAPKGWQSRAHFFAVAAVAMRQILTDHARKRRALKRGGDAKRVTLAAADAGGPAPEIDAVELDELLGKLKEADERKHRVVELRFFGGLEMREIAEVLGISISTVEADWRAARAWLASRLRPHEPA